MVICNNAACGKEFTPTPRSDNRPQLYCSRECFHERKKAYIWEATKRDEKPRHIARYRDEEKCGEDPILPIERAFVNYCTRCLPNAPTYDFEDWYDIHLTFGPIDW